MVDKLKNTNIQDLMFAKALGISKGEVERTDLFRQKNQMQNLAFKYKHDNIDITQNQADDLNIKYQEIVSLLENEYDMDLSCDYWINFNSFVPENSYYRKFCY